MILIRREAMAAFLWLQVVSPSCLAADTQAPAVTRVIQVLNTIEDYYVQAPDMSQLTSLTISEASKRSKVGAETWQRCFDAHGVAEMSRKQRELAVTAAWQCAELDQGTTEEADAASDAVIRAVIESLDAQSRWINSNDFKSLRGEGPRGGVGVTVAKAGHKLVIVRTGAKSPAREAGVKDGDTIVAIDDASTAELSLKDAIDRLRGSAGSSVTLTIQNDHAPPRSLNLQREVTDPVKSQVEVSRWSDVAVVRIVALPKGGAAYLEALLARQSPSPKSLIIDLRGNEGGLLDEVIAMSDIFLEKATIFTSHSRPPYGTETLTSRKGQAIPNIPIFILVDKTTASGAEIITAALQDNKRATVIGQRSFGSHVVGQKGAASGTAQTLFPVDGQHILKLTTSFQYRPNGLRLADAPIIPDCESILEGDDLLSFAIEIAANGHGCAIDAPVAH